MVSRPFHPILGSEDPPSATGATASSKYGSASAASPHPVSATPSISFVAATAAAAAATQSVVAPTASAFIDKSSQASNTLTPISSDTGTAFVRGTFSTAKSVSASEPDSPPPLPAATDQSKPAPKHQVYLGTIQTSDSPITTFQTSDDANADDAVMSLAGFDAVASSTAASAVTNGEALQSSLTVSLSRSF